MNRYDFTYWGAPVAGFTLGALSPNTLSDKYFSWTPTISNGAGNWQNQSTSSVMALGKGYIVRAPQTYNITGAKTSYTATFVGTPNNGNITTPIAKGTFTLDTAPDDTTVDEWNLIANPYPSALDAAKFLASNAAVLDGTIYFWTHNSPPSTATLDPFYGDYVYNYTDSDYASWNKTGGVGTAGTVAGGIGTGATTGGNTPSGYIASGQAFFVKTASTLADGTAFSGTATFNNTMRVAGNNNQFFKFAPHNSKKEIVEQHRIWLNLTDNAGAFSQILVGYTQGATNDLDRDFDGEAFGGNAVGFYSILPQANLTIQGRSLPFDDSDQVDLGYYSDIEGTLSIRIDHLDGLFSTESIFLEDKELGIIHDLKAAPYVFTTGMGDFDDRFSLLYNDGTSKRFLETTDFDASKNNVLVFVKNKKIRINSFAQSLDKVIVYDVLGKQLYQKTRLNANELTVSSVASNEQILVVKILLQNGQTVTKKVVME
jgi:hypothetical protein